MIYLLIIGILLIFFGLFFLKPNSKEEIKDKKEIAIETISKLWKQRATEIEIEKLVNIWLNEDIKNVQEFNIKFNIKLIQNFYNLYIKNIFDKVSEEIIIELLKLLDEKGNISSVRRKEGDSNNEIPDITYQIIAKVPLYEHSIRVAEEIIKLTDVGISSPFTKQKAVIAALAHDIGKIFANEDNYKKFDHPALSATFLEKNIPAFQNYNGREEILNAIRGHHKSSAYAILTDFLKKADKSAREIEMKLYKDKIINEENNQDINKESFKDIKLDINEKDIIKQEKIDNKQEKEFKKEIIKDEVNNISDNQVSLSDWIDSIDEKKLLKQISDSINILDNYGRFQALSMNDGTVIVRPEYIFDLIKEYIPSSINVSNEEDRRKLLIILANYFIKKCYLNVKYIKENYFSAPFIITLDNGRELKGLYMPWNVEVFSEYGILSDFESRKSDWLKNIVSIKRKFGAN
jgi:HD superfamily phosphohydrolase YqeK